MPGLRSPRCPEIVDRAEKKKELDTTPRYAEKLIHTCLRRAREIYTNITAVLR